MGAGVTLLVLPLLISCQFSPKSSCTHHTTEFSFTGYKDFGSISLLDQAIYFLEKIKSFSDQEVKSLIKIYRQIDSKDLSYEGFSSAESQCSILIEDNAFKIIKDIFNVRFN